MILEQLLTLLNMIFLSKIPTIIIDFSQIETALRYIQPILGNIMYFMPIPTIVKILSISFALYAIRLALALLKTIWDSLPIV